MATTLEELKTQLEQLFGTYGPSREGWVTYFFRDRELTDKKKALAIETIALINKFDGTKEELITELKIQRDKNARHSIDHRKRHHNLLNDRLREETTYKTQYETQPDPRFFNQYPYVVNYSVSGPCYYQPPSLVIEKTVPVKRTVCDVFPGESSRKSDLAALFHQAIDIVSRSEIDSVVKNSI